MRAGPEVQFYTTADASVMHGMMHAWRGVGEAFTAESRRLGGAGSKRLLQQVRKKPSWKQCMFTSDWQIVYMDRFHAIPREVASEVGGDPKNKHVMSVSASGLQQHTVASTNMLRLALTCADTTMPRSLTTYCQNQQLSPSAAPTRCPRTLLHISSCLVHLQAVREKQRCTIW